MTTPSPSLDLAIIGNSNIAALIDSRGTITWACWPHIDGDPIFCSLVDGSHPASGFFSIGFDDGSTAKQSYERNTAVVQTIVTSESGAAFSITDFVPRFHQH